MRSPPPRLPLDAPPPGSGPASRRPLHLALLPALAPRPHAAYAIVAAAVPIHLVLALRTDLSPDEAYYLVAARMPGALPPLVDHPPLLPWLLRIGDLLGPIGAPVELRVRLFPMLFSAATSATCIELARQRGADAQGCLLAALVSSFALLPMTGGFVATPDGPALLAIALALLALGRTLTLRRGALAAAALLAGALAKVVVLPIAFLLAAFAYIPDGLDPQPAPLAGTDEARSARQRHREHRTACAVLALGPLLTLPLLRSSLRFQLHHAFRQGAPLGWSFLGAVGAVLGAATAQALLWSPLVLARGLCALGRLPRAERAVALGLTTLVLLSALARAIPPEPNWWAPAALIVLVAAASAGSSTSRAHLATVLSVLLPTAVALAHTLTPFLPLPPAADPTARLHGWSHGEAPRGAAGIGLYGEDAERCVYQRECSKIDNYFKQMKLNH
jgi:Dolichyl-phosphate-mannose-protein mannosyltransferase